MASKPPFSTFISADWSKERRKRSVHVADVVQRRIWRPDARDWDLSGLLALARDLASTGPVLVGLDLALGVPEGYWSTAVDQPRWRRCSSFLHWIETLDPSSEFDTTPQASEWRVDRPFFHIPPGKGSLNAYRNRIPGGLLREIDQLVGAKPIFAVSGIPGTVGSGTRDMWTELIPLLGADRDFAVWPFDGELEQLLATRPVTLAETYPGLAYAAALSAALPTPRVRISKTKGAAREAACELLLAAPWVADTGVSLGDLEPARLDEDAFDSHLTAAAVLRCVLDGVSLRDAGFIDPTAAGGILLAGPVDPRARTETLTPAERPGPAKLDAQRKLDLASKAPPPSANGARLPEARSSTNGEAAASRESRATRSTSEYRCPIPGCTKAFRGSRGGWDAHVGSLRIHPDWHPRISDPEERRRRFRSDFEDWF